MTYCFMKTLSAGLVTTLLIGCGGGSSEPNSPVAPTPTCPPGQVPSGGTCVASGPAPAPTQTPPPAVPQGPPFVTPGPSATAVDGSLVALLLQPLAQQHAPPGAQPIGAAMAGQFKAGQTLEQTLQLQPGKCYTVVGAGAPTVSNLDIQLLAPNPLGGASPVVAQDQSVGTTAVLGPAPNCFHWAPPVSAPLRLVVTVTAGEGLAGAQVYEK